MTAMKTEAITDATYEFDFPRLDTLLQVEVAGRAIVIRATRDTFDAGRKVAFIRELASEGFIPGEYAWVAERELGEGDELRWVVDCRWPELPAAWSAEARRLLRRWLMGAIVLWIGLMSVFVCLRPV